MASYLQMDQPGHPKVACGVMVSDLQRTGSVSVDTRGRIFLAGGSDARPVDRGRLDRAEPLANPARQAKPQRLVRIHSDYGPMDTSFRFEPDGEATRFIIDADYELPGKLPGFVKDFMSAGWMDRNMRRMFEDFKALAEARVPTHA